MEEPNTQFYTVSVRTFVIPFYYGSGSQPYDSSSAMAKSYGSYGSGSGSATLFLNVAKFCFSLVCYAYVSVVVVHGGLVHVLEHQVPDLPHVRVQRAASFPTNRKLP
jgi:hypothetical protein